jgi:hypothetical protein
VCRGTGCISIARHVLCVHWAAGEAVKARKGLIRTTRGSKTEMDPY